jgi:hypothetical protein
MIPIVSIARQEGALTSHLRDYGGELNMPPVNVPRRMQLFEIWIRTLPNAQAPFALRAALRELQLLVDEGLNLSDAEAGRDSRGRSHHRSLAVEARRRAHDDYPRRRSVRTLATQRMQSPDHSLT